MLAGLPATHPYNPSVLETPPLPKFMNLLDSFPATIEFVGGEWREPRNAR